jgi:hypothetical protein
VLMLRDLALLADLSPSAAAAPDHSPS